MLRSVTALALALAAAAPSAAPAAYDVHAVRFAHVSYPMSSLVRGAEPGRAIDIAFTIWVMRGEGRVVLLDAGFHREKFLARWKPLDFATPAEALRRGLGIAPGQVTDVVISHAHWDHADGADLFPRATIWIQKEEIAHIADPDVARMFADLSQSGRVRLVDGDAREILPGIRVYTGGKHTVASQFVGVTTSTGTVVLASDNAYLYENLEKKLPIAQTLDAGANLAAQARMLSLASSPSLVIPGHDPAVFDRFPAVAPGVVKISR
jgi:glyoxylase-like metal-dependent hydrolase (beta-lactamase superfamily II)